MRRQYSAPGDEIATRKPVTVRRYKGYTRLIVVTSDYHMPRSMVEIRSAYPGVELTPYAVETPSLDNSGWWKAAVTARRPA